MHEEILICERKTFVGQSPFTWYSDIYDVKIWKKIIIDGDIIGLWDSNTGGNVTVAVEGSYDRETWNNLSLDLSMTTSTSSQDGHIHTKVKLGTPATPHIRLKVSALNTGGSIIGSNVGFIGTFKLIVF